jgi:Meiotically up-regulated gene 113
MSSVYLMKNMANGYYKIGRSGQPPVRERTLQAQEPDIRLLASIEARAASERQLQQRYARKRVRGEWFALDYGDLFDVASWFRTNTAFIDPPVDTIDGDTWIAAVHKYAPDRYSTRVVRPRSRQWLFEVPYALSRCEIEEEVTTQAFGCEVPSDLCDFLERCVPNVRLDEYSTDGSRVELRELMGFAGEERSGFYVLPNEYVLPRFFYDRGYADKFFWRVKRIFDAYAKLNAAQ